MRTLVVSCRAGIVRGGCKFAAVRRCPMCRVALCRLHSKAWKDKRVCGYCYMHMPPASFAEINRL